MKMKTQADPVATDRRALGQAIRALRDERGLTLQDLANHVGKSVPTLSQIERGGQAITYDVLAKIARALGITPAGLVWRAQPKPKNLSPEMDRIYTVFDEMIRKLDPSV